MNQERRNRKNSGGVKWKIKWGTWHYFFPSSQLSPSVLVHVNVHCCTFGGLLPKKEQAHGNEDGLSFGGGVGKVVFWKGMKKPQNWRTEVLSRSTSNIKRFENQQDYLKRVISFQLRF